MIDDETLLRRALAALGPYRPELVVVGAWAHRFFQRHPLAQPLDHEPLRTEDADLATPTELPISGDRIPTRLEAAGFEPRLEGAARLPTMKFVARDGNGFYVEFIAPLIGGDVDRHGEPRTLVEVGGATAQLLRHVELLRFEPRELELEDHVVVRVANPVSYLAQKVLTRREGAGREKIGKDLLYVYDTLQMFGARLGELRPLGNRVLAQLHANHAAKLRAGLQMNSDAWPALAAEIALSTGRPSPPSAFEISVTCRKGLGEIFGS